VAQLARAHDGMLPTGWVRDHPDLPVRGVMLDISRDKVPTMESLRRVVDLLASLKVNQVQLYSEHTFAYRSHGEVHAAASPLDAAEIRELDAFCRARHVELVPNQNCLGHMNRWLAHDRYRPLAIAPEGFVDPFGISRQPMTIEPGNPDSLKLVRELLAELLPLFTSRRVHVGLDEAWELPAERMEDFLGWVTTLRAVPELEGREMLMWGDMISGRTDLVARLPAGVTVCEWGYDDWHPFDEHCAALAEAGVPFWVAPGTSSWLSILGRFTNARSTCSRAAAAALAHGGSGYLNTDWGDNGHLQQWVVGEPGLAYGAAVSWCYEANDDIDMAAALSAHVFEDPSGRLAETVLALGDAHRLVTPQFPNMSALVMNLYYPQLPVGRGLTAGLTDDELDTVASCLADARTGVTGATPRRDDGAWLIDEVVYSADLVSLLVRDSQARLRGDGTLASVGRHERAALGAELDEIMQRARELWLRRNRPGGLEDSLGWLRNLRAAYATGHPDPEWGGISVRAR
jgi:hexosaminidase